MDDKSHRFLKRTSLGISLNFGCIQNLKHPWNVRVPNTYSVNNHIFREMLSTYCDSAPITLDTQQIFAELNVYIYIS